MTEHRFKQKALADVRLVQSRVFSREVTVHGTEISGNGGGGELSLMLQCNCQDDCIKMREGAAPDITV